MILLKFKKVDEDSQQDNALKEKQAFLMQGKEETIPLEIKNPEQHNAQDVESGPSEETDVASAKKMNENSENGDWKLPIDVFLEAKHGKAQNVPKKIRKFYKKQDKLIEEFDVIYKTAINNNSDDENDSDIDKEERKAELAARISFFTNFLLLCGKVIATVLSGSLSIMSSLVDSAVDLLSGIVMWCTSAAMKRRDYFKYPTGKKRMEPLAILTLAIIMAMASAMVILKSVEQIQKYAEEGLKLGPKVDLTTIILICITIAAKLTLFLTMFRVKNASVKTLAQDHRNDVISNIVALVMGYVGSKYWNYADPVGAIVIAIYILGSWVMTAYEQVRLLVGRAATPDFQKKLTWICINHNSNIHLIDTVTAFHYGRNFLVEVHIVLPEHMHVKEAHEIQESLQNKLEKLEEVERAFVHIDYEASHNPSDEHKLV